MALGKSPILDALKHNMSKRGELTGPEALQLAQLETLDRIARALEAIAHSGLTTWKGEV